MTAAESAWLRSDDALSFGVDDNFSILFGERPDVGVFEDIE